MDVTRNSNPPNNFPALENVRAAVPQSYEQVTGLSVAKGLTVPPGTKYAIIQPESQAVRWRDDGPAPTASVGMEAPVGVDLFYDGDLTKIRFIQVAASAKLNVSYYA